MEEVLQIKQLRACENITKSQLISSLRNVPGRNQAGFWRHLTGYPRDRSDATVRLEMKTSVNDKMIRDRLGG